MAPLGHVLWGVGVGFLLMVFAFPLNVPEGQMHLAFVLNSGLFYVIPRDGPIIAAVIPPFLWGIYFYFLSILAFKNRIWALLAIFMVHSVPLFWITFFERKNILVAVNPPMVFLIPYVATLTVAVVSILLIALKGSVLSNAK